MRYAMRLSKILQISLGSTFRGRVWVFIFFFSVNLFSVVVFNKFIQPQGYEYEAIARSLLEGTGYSGAFTGGAFGHSSFMAPLYPGLIYLSFKIFGAGNWWPIQLFQVLLLSLVPLVLLMIRKKLFADHPGLSWGILLLPCIVPFTMFSAYIGPASILTLLITTGFYLLIVTAEQPRWSYFIGLGILAGITGLTDPVPVLFFVVGFTWLLFRLRGRAVIRWLVGGLIAFVLVIPWLYRNYREFGAFPVVKIQTGWNLWWGNNPFATGGIHNKDGGEYTVVFDALSPAEKDSLIHWNEWERDRFYMHKAFGAIRNWIRTDPLGYLKLKFKSLLFYWFGDAWNLNLQKALVMRGADPRLSIFFTLTLIPSAFLLIFGVTGLIIALVRQNSRANTILFLLILIFWSSIYMITHGHTFNRYRIPLDPILLMYSVLSLNWFINLSRSTKVVTKSSEKEEGR